MGCSASLELVFPYVMSYGKWKSSLAFVFFSVDEDCVCLVRKQIAKKIFKALVKVFELFENVFALLGQVDALALAADLSIEHAVEIVQRNRDEQMRHSAGAQHCEHAAVVPIG